MEIDSEVKYLKKLNTIITILKSRFMLHIPLHIKSIIVQPASRLTCASSRKLFGGGAALPQGVLGPLSSRDCGSAAKNFSRTRTTQPARGLIINVRGVL